MRMQMRADAACGDAQRAQLCMRLRYRLQRTYAQCLSFTRLRVAQRAQPRREAARARDYDAFRHEKSAAFEARVCAHEAQAKMPLAARRCAAKEFASCTALVSRAESELRLDTYASQQRREASCDTSL